MRSTLQQFGFVPGRTLEDEAGRLNLLHRLAFLEQAIGLNASERIGVSHLDRVFTFPDSVQAHGGQAAAVDVEAKRGARDKSLAVGLGNTGSAGMIRHQTEQWMPPSGLESALAALEPLAQRFQLDAKVRRLRHYAAHGNLVTAAREFQILHAGCGGLMGAFGLRCAIESVQRQLPPPSSSAERVVMPPMDPDAFAKALGAANRFEMEGRFWEAARTFKEMYEETFDLQWLDRCALCKAKRLEANGS